MVISRQEFYRFSINGRLRLLEQYGVLELEIITLTQAMSVFRIGDFHAVVTRNFIEGGKLSVEPVLQKDLLPFFFLS